MARENKGKKASPLDFFRRSTEYCADDEARERYVICINCPEIIKATNQCKQCGCFMNLKVKLKRAECPLGKW
jgi:hypothetical protein